MRPPMHPWILSAALLLTLAPDLVAQPLRQGFGGGIGLGIGSAQVTCDDCDDSRESGLSGFLRLGGYVTPGLLLGLESNGWVRSEAGVDEQLGYLSGVAVVYPDSRQTWFFKGGLGYSMHRAESATDELTVSGVAVSVGTGVDIPLSRSVALSPYANYLRTFSGTVRLNGVDAGLTVGVNVIQAGLAVTWY